MVMEIKMNKMLVGYSVMMGFMLQVHAQTTELQMIQLSREDSTGLAGDNFSLEGALELFQKANSPEQLEQWLNDENQHVNNLDLNEDGEVDYIKVLDQASGKDHALILQVPLSSGESQDVAVIELSQLTADSAIVQIVGDEFLYGSDIILEPSMEFEQEFKKIKGPALESFRIYKRCINVWWWPCVQFMYRPIYQPWVSPYYWQHYPPYWKPWKRHQWHRHWWYCHQHHHYGAHYWKAKTVRCAATHAAYRNRRVFAPSIDAHYHHGHRARQKQAGKNDHHPPRMGDGKNHNGHPKKGSGRGKTSKGNGGKGGH